MAATPSTLTLKPLLEMSDFVSAGVAAGLSGALGRSAWKEAGSVLVTSVVTRLLAPTEIVANVATSGNQQYIIGAAVGGLMKVNSRNAGAILTEAAIYGGSLWAGDLLTNRIWGADFKIL